MMEVEQEIGELECLPLKTAAAALAPVTITSSDKSRMTLCLLCNTCISNVAQDDGNTEGLSAKTNSNDDEDIKSLSSSWSPDLGMIKMEVIDDDTKEGMNNSSHVSINHTLQQQQQHELMSFLQKQFKIIIQIFALNDIVEGGFDTEYMIRFCPSCSNQLLAFKRLHSQLSALRKQVQGLKQEITGSFNKSFRIRRKQQKRARRLNPSAMSSTSTSNQHIPATNNADSTSSPAVRPSDDDNSLLIPLQKEEAEESHSLGSSPIYESTKTEHDSTTTSASSVLLHLNPCNVVLHRIVEESLPSKSQAHIKKSKNLTSSNEEPKPKRKRKRKSNLDGRKDGPFPCAVCSKSFTMKFKRDIHMRLHTGVKPYVCGVCNKAFHRQDSYKCHVTSQHTAIKPYICEVCGQMFSYRTSYRHHLAKHHDVILGSPNQCSACPERFLWPSQLKQHVMNVHEFGGTPPNKKIKTNTSSKKKSSLPREKTTKTSTNQCKCKHCDQVFSAHQNMLRHIRTVHEGERPFQCTTCGECFTVMACLKLHMVHHTGQKLHGCDYCQERFNRLVHKKAHMVQVHPELHLVEKPFVCSICYSNFSTETGRDEHALKLHDKFKCKVCNKGFSNGARHKAHMRIHTGEKPFVCQICAKAFNQSENLKEHLYRHTGERPFKCTVQDCNKGFLRRKELTIHMEKMHASSPQLPQL